MKSYAEMNKKELHKELRWVKRKFQSIAKEEYWADWIVFYSWSDMGYEIINEMKKRGLADYEHNLIWWWQSAKDKAQGFLDKKFPWR